VTTGAGTDFLAAGRDSGGGRTPAGGWVSVTGDQWYMMDISVMTVVVALCRHASRARRDG